MLLFKYLLEQDNNAIEGLVHSVKSSQSVPDPLQINKHVLTFEFRSKGELQDEVMIQSTSGKTVQYAFSVAYSGGFNCVITPSSGRITPQEPILPVQFTLHPKSVEARSLNTVITLEILNGPRYFFIVHAER